MVGREECLLLLLILRASDTKESELDWHSMFGKIMEAYLWEAEPHFNKEEEEKIMHGKATISKEFQTQFRSC